MKFIWIVDSKATDSDQYPNPLRSVAPQNGTTYDVALVSSTASLVGTFVYRPSYRWHAARVRLEHAFTRVRTFGALQSVEFLLEISCALVRLLSSSFFVFAVSRSNQPISQPRVFSSCYACRPNQRESSPGVSRWSPSMIFGSTNDSDPTKRLARERVFESQDW